MGEGSAGNGIRVRCTTNDPDAGDAVIVHVDAHNLTVDREVIFTVAADKYR